VGGVLTVLYGSTNPEGVVGFINFSGGAAGFATTGKSCSENQLMLAYGQAGQVNKLPNLWLYAENDGFWGAEAPRRWHHAFAHAGGPSTTFFLAPALEARDGHYLLNYGGRYWGKAIDTYMDALDLETAQPLR